MTNKQIEYARLRATGLGQRQAALKAGYAPGSAKVVASRMERMPAIRAAIAEAKSAAADTADPEQSEFDSAEAYLSAVVRGQTPPDPVRVGAARALLPFERARQRAPMKSASPRQLAHRDTLAGEKALLDDWATKAEAVRARLKRERKT